MVNETRKSVDRRLARIEGQIRGLRRMVSEDTYCGDVLVQLAAARSALDQVGVELAASHVRHCIVGHSGPDAHPKAQAMSEEELMDEMSALLSRLLR